MSDSLWLRGLQHARLLLSPRVCSDSCLLSQYCYLTISSSIAPFSFCLQYFPESGSFLASQLFTSGGQSIGVSASASVLPMNIWGWFPLRLVWSPCSPRDSHESSPALQFESINYLAFSLLYDPALISIHDYWKNHSFDYKSLAKWCLCFLICSWGWS